MSDPLITSLPIIPITEFQRNTKTAFNKVKNRGYHFVTSRNKEIAVVMDPDFFRKLAEAYQYQESINNAWGLWKNDKRSSITIQKSLRKNINKLDKNTFINTIKKWEKETES